MSRPWEYDYSVGPALESTWTEEKVHINSTSHTHSYTTTTTTTTTTVSLDLYVLHKPWGAGLDVFLEPLGHVHTYITPTTLTLCLTHVILNRQGQPAINHARAKGKKGTKHSPKGNTPK